MQYGSYGLYGAEEDERKKKKKADPREDEIRKAFRKAGYKVADYTYLGEGSEGWTHYKAKDFKFGADRKKDKKLSQFVDAATKLANKYKISTRRQKWSPKTDEEGNFVFAFKYDKKELKKWEDAKKAKRKKAGQARGQRMLDDLPPEEEEGSGMGLWLVGGAALAFGAWYMTRRGK